MLKISLKYNSYLKNMQYTITYPILEQSKHATRYLTSWSSPNYPPMVSMYTLMTYFFTGTFTSMAISSNYKISRLNLGSLPVCLPSYCLLLSWSLCWAKMILGSFKYPYEWLVLCIHIYLAINANVGACMGYAHIKFKVWPCLGLGLFLRLMSQGWEVVTLSQVGFL